MLDFYLLQAGTPGVSWEMFRYVVGGMAVGIISVCLFLKWIITRTLTTSEERFDKALEASEERFKEVLKTANDWHNEAMAVLKESNERGIADGAKRAAESKETRSDIKEIKYSILNINKTLGIKDVNKD